MSKETYNKLTHSTCTGARHFFARALELAPQVVLSITLLGTKLLFCTCPPARAKCLETVAKKAEGESAGWTVKLIIFVGGTCGSVHVQTFNSNFKELGVVESKRNAIRRGFVHELLNAQDTVLCSYFAHEK